MLAQPLVTLPAAITPDSTGNSSDSPPAAPSRGSLQALIQSSQLALALTLCERLLIEAPQDAELQAIHARLLYWLGRLGPAEKQARALHAEHPEDSELTELLAQILLAAGEKSESLTLYQQLVAAGDRRPELAARVVDLQLSLGDVPGVEQSVQQGLTLNDEQRIQFAKLVHPWLVDVGSMLTLHDQQSWVRLDADAGRRINANWTLVGGVLGERRGPTGITAYSLRLQGYFLSGKWGGLLHLEGSPTATFLPTADLRADVMHQTFEQVSLGLYLRYAHYSSDTAPVDALAVAPNVAVALGSWTINPGYMLVMNHTGASPPQTDPFHTLFVKTRWQQSAYTSLFLWLFVGQDPTFLEHSIGTNLQQSAGLSGLLGVDHWFTGQWGVRASVSRVQPFGVMPPFTEFGLVVRGRL